MIKVVVYIPEPEYILEYITPIFLANQYSVLTIDNEPGELVSWCKFNFITFGYVTLLIISVTSFANIVPE